MGKVQYFTACTLDGFIADENNSLDWLYEVPHDVDDGYWDRWFPGIGGLVMGATTYEWMLERYGLADSTERWREFYGDRPGWVFTHRGFRSFRVWISRSSRVRYSESTPRSRRSSASRISGCSAAAIWWDSSTTLVFSTRSSSG